MNFLRPRPHIILTVGDEGVVVVPLGIEAAEPFFVATDNKQSIQQIAQFINRHTHAKVTLLADTMTQDYRCDTVPRLNFHDRSKLIRRRLKQSFPAAKLSASLSCKNSREQVLLLGLHESNPVFGWVEHISAHLPKIAFLPVEGARLVTKLMPEAKAGWAMMISRNRSGGFRQIVTYRGDLVFTRLTPLPDTGNEPEIIARDIKASLIYLSRQGLRDSSALSVLLLMTDNLHSDAAFKSLSLQSLRSQSPFAAARQLGLSFGPCEGDNDADLLFSASLAKYPRTALSLRLPEQNQIWWTRIIQKYGTCLAGFALSAALLLTIWRAGDLANSLYQLQKESLQLARIHHELAEARRNSAPATEPLARLRQALGRKHIYAQPTTTPWQGLNELAGGLSDDVKIIKLEWQKENDASAEKVDVSLQLMTAMDRDKAVAVFEDSTKKIAQTMTDYDVSIASPPFPALPQQSITTETAHDSDVATGEIIMQRKAHD